MRYVILIMAILCDLLIMAGCGILIYNLPKFGIMGIIICIVLIAMTYSTYMSQGGFIAWRPSTIKQFLKNAKEMGL